MQVVWAVALAQLKQSDDVLFGITVSGRSADLPGIESMVGLFINSLPLRVRLVAAQSVSGLLHTLQQTGGRRADHEHVSAADLHRWNCISGQHPFDSLLVVENFPWADRESKDTPLRMASFRGDIATHYPLTLVVMPGERLQLKLYYMDELMDQAAADQLLGMVQGLLLAIVDNFEIQVGELRQLCTAQIPFRTIVSENQEQLGRPRRWLHRSRQWEDAPTKQSLLRAWRETLQLKDIGINDNFFDLGGNSFLGLVLLDHIKRITGKQLPLVTIFQAPTIAEMVALLEQGFGRLPGTRLIPINRTGERRPFFMVHGGNWMASILASHLDVQQPFYILDSHWDHADIGLDQTVEQLAAAYIEDMRGIQTVGPWLIGGYSMGAVIVGEMALQLQSLGEQVELLFLLDPPARPEIFKNIDGFPGNRPSKGHVHTDQTSKTAPLITGKLARKREELAQCQGPDKATYVLREVKGLAGFLVRRTYSRLLKQYRSQIVEPTRLAIAQRFHRRGKPVPVALRNEYVACAYRLACKRYRPRRYNGSMVIFSGDKCQSWCIWDHLATQKNERVSFNGDHLEFTRTPELIHRWAAEFIKYLDQAQH